MLNLYYAGKITRTRQKEERLAAAFERQNQDCCLGRE